MKVMSLSALSFILLLGFNCATTFASEAAVLSETIAKQAGISEEKAKEQIQTVFSAIESELKAGNAVRVRRFGKFSVHARKSRMGRNPKSGEAIKIPARNYPKFSSSDVLKKLVNEG